MPRFTRTLSLLAVTFVVTVVAAYRMPVARVLAPDELSVVRGAVDCFHTAPQQCPPVQNPQDCSGLNGCDPGAGRQCNPLNTSPLPGPNYTKAVTGNDTIRTETWEPVPCLVGYPCNCSQFGLAWVCNRGTANFWGLYQYPSTAIGDPCPPPNS